MARNPNPTKPRPLGTLKAAYAELVTACGGQERAGELVELSQSQVQRITDADSANRRSHFSCQQVRALQMHCGQPVVSRFLDGDLGYVPFRPSLAPASSSLPEEIAGIGEKMAKLFAEFASAIADGHISATEAARMMVEGDTMVGRYMAMRAGLMAQVDLVGA